MECPPTLNADVVNVAFPALSVPVPNVAAPSLNVTGPVAVPPCALTVAVNVTACPNTDAFCDDVTAVVVVVAFTVCVSGADVLPLKFPSPPYDAVTEWVPAASADVVKLAVPEVTVPVPSVVVPSLNVTAPVGGVPPCALTVAVNVTA